MVIFPLSDSGFKRRSAVMDAHSEHLVTARRREALAELLEPVPDRDVRPIDAEPAEYALDFAEAHAAIVEHDR